MSVCRRGGARARPCVAGLCDTDSLARCSVVTVAVGWTLLALARRVVPPPATALYEWHPCAAADTHTYALVERRAPRDFTLTSIVREDVEFTYKGRRSTAKTLAQSVV